MIALDVSVAAASLAVLGAAENVFWSAMPAMALFTRSVLPRARRQ